MMHDIEARFYGDGSARLVVLHPKGYDAIPAGSRAFDRKDECLRAIGELRAQGYTVIIPGERK